MKKTLLLLAAAIVAVSPLAAGNGNGDTAANINVAAEIPAYAPAAKSDKTTTKAKKGPWDRKKYINLGYIKQTLSPEFGNAFESKFGASFSSGRNIYLHKKPIANILKFAIDFGSEINYAQYKDLVGDYNFSDNDFGYTDESDNNYDLGYDDEEDMDLGLHHIDVGLHIGPSISINPVSHLKILAYFRFVPSYSMLLLSENFYQGFTPLFSYGGEISYKFIGIGIEGRTGSAKYKDIIAEYEGTNAMKIKYKTSAMRVYISFRF